MIAGDNATIADAATGRREMLVTLHLDDQGTGDDLFGDAGADRIFGQGGDDDVVAGSDGDDVEGNEGRATRSRVAPATTTSSVAALRSTGSSTVTGSGRADPMPMT